MSIENKNSIQYDPFKDPVLRREAGEGWHERGLDMRVLAAIVAREGIVKAGPAHHEGPDQDYVTQTAMVESLKQESGIGEPPPRIDY